MSNTGLTETFILVSSNIGVEPFYYSDLCSVPNQKIQSYERDSPRGSSVLMNYSLDGE